MSKKKGRIGKAVLSMIAVLMAAVLCVSAVGYFTDADWWPLKTQTEDAGDAGEESDALLEAFNALRDNYAVLDAQLKELQAAIDAGADDKAMLQTQLEALQAQYDVLLDFKEEYGVSSEVSERFFYINTNGNCLITEPLFVNGKVSFFFPIDDINLPGVSYQRLAYEEYQAPMFQSGRVYYYRFFYKFHEAGRYKFDFNFLNLQAIDLDAVPNAYFRYSYLVDPKTGYASGSHFSIFDPDENLRAYVDITEASVNEKKDFLMCFWVGEKHYPNPYTYPSYSGRAFSMDKINIDITKIS